DYYCFSTDSTNDHSLF
nr:immunoglobulin light chain junction region [Macaca mulatta]MOV99115.1 immunoglobulin light chain junction region [Macaca mulatta]MOW00710.1 immunoglobulin light chain junction region [Macaca mulatta]MOW18067.1 immunoglobulin light chain junction region [Macaca mulatta]